MAGNTVAIEFAGDASKLQKAGGQADKTLETVGKSATDTGDKMTVAGKSTDQYVDRVGKLGAAVGGATDALDAVGAATQAVVDIQNAGRERAMRLARANADIEQAMIDTRQAAVDLKQAQEDLNQANLDGRQAGIDLEQAQIDQRQAVLDASTAQKDYNTAVKEHGAGSAEAQQAAIDLKQAQSDLRQANLDASQATADSRQATIDASQATVDATQAVRDGKDAQLNLNDAMAEANPTGLAKFAENIGLVTPLLSALVGVVGLITAAQWAWNIAQLASPTTWIILAIVALVAIIVVIATKTDWFQRLWKFAWGGIKDAAMAVGRFFRDQVWGRWLKPTFDFIVAAGQRVWDFMKKIPGFLAKAWATLATALTAPFRIAFNAIASLWNNTVGKLSFTIPAWVPGVGGKGFDVPDIPKFHAGGTVPGAPGSEVLAVLQAGETVTSRSGSVGGERWLKIDLGDLGAALLPSIAKAVERQGGRVTSLGVKVVGGQVRG